MSKKQQLGVWVDEEFRESVKRIAAAEGISLSSWVRRAILQAVRSSAGAAMKLTTRDMPDDESA